eukprot:4080507-Pyramimonas_sp.AAC.1
MSTLCEHPASRLLPGVMMSETAPEARSRRGARCISRARKSGMSGSQRIWIQLKPMAEATSQLVWRRRAALKADESLTARSQN